MAPLFARWSAVEHRLHSPAVPGIGGVEKGRHQMECCRKNTEQKLLAEGTRRWELIAWVLPVMSKIFQVCCISFYPLYKQKILPRALPKPCFHLYMCIISARVIITPFFCVHPSTTALLLQWSTTVITMSDGWSNRKIMGNQRAEACSRTPQPCASADKEKGVKRTWMILNEAD